MREGKRSEELNLTFTEIDWDTVCVSLETSDSSLSVCQEMFP